MMRIGSLLLRTGGLLRTCSFLETSLIPAAINDFKVEGAASTRLNLIKRGLKTTDTIHPQPVYDEDEKILQKVLEERHKDTDDLPIGMANPYEKPKQKCILCQHGLVPNWKNVKLLYQFVSPYTGMMYERHVTGLCKQQYDNVERQIKIAQHRGLMSSYMKGIEFLKDPVVCDPERPIKPHKWC